MDLVHDDRIGSLENFQIVIQLCVSKIFSVSQPSLHLICKEYLKDKLS